MPQRSLVLHNVSDTVEDTLQIYQITSCREFLYLAISETWTWSNVSNACSAIGRKTSAQSQSDCSVSCIQMELCHHLEVPANAHVAIRNSLAQHSHFWAAKSSAHKSLESVNQIIPFLWQRFQHQSVVANVKVKITYVSLMHAGRHLASRANACPHGAGLRKRPNCLPPCKHQKMRPK